MNIFDVIRFSKVKNPELIDNEYLTSQSCPLKEDRI